MIKEGNVQRSILEPCEQNLNSAHSGGVPVCNSTFAYNMNLAEDFRILKVARRHLSIYKVYLVGMVDMVDMVNNMDMVDNVNMDG